MLVLLDCCYASQAARDSRASEDSSSVPLNVELFAACGMGQKTVCPGPRSFTSILITELRQQLAAHKYATIALAHRNMASKYSHLAQSAIHFTFEHKRTTRLEPFHQSKSFELGAIVRPETASLVLQFSLTTGDRPALEDVIEWLKLNPPRTISKVVVENIITSANAVYEYASPQDDGSRSMANFANLSEPAKKDISSAWCIFSNTVATLAASMKRMPSARIVSAPSDESDAADDVVHQLDRSLKPLENAIERNVLSLPELDDKSVLLKAIDDKIMKDLGFVDTLNLRLLARFNEQTARKTKLETDMDSSTFKMNGPFVNFSIEGISELGRVLVECKEYGKSVDERAITASKQHMEKLAILLGSSKSDDFHTLNCLRFFHDSTNRRSGLIFGIPEAARQHHITLRDIIRLIQGKFKPTLSQRFQIAYKIGKAMAKWHLVDYVHQGIASHNILFFYDEAQGVDFSNPYLCGFEYSRESGAPSTGRYVVDFELNVYRHPDRQGATPSRFHRKEHDIYAYGVLLLEIGTWKLVNRFFDETDRQSLTTFVMMNTILTTAQEQLGHLMGTGYQEAASVCLTGEFAVQQDDKAQSRLAAAFETQVLQKINRGIVINEY